MRLKSLKISPKILVGRIAILLLLGLVVYQLKDTIVNFWPTEYALDEARRQLKRDQQRHQESLNDACRLQFRSDSFYAKKPNFWIPSRDGAPETTAQSKIEQAAQKASLTLSSIGNPRQTNIGEGVSLFEISIDTTAPIDKVTDFLAELYNTKPCFHWQNLTIRPENLRKPENVKLNGRLRFLTITNEQVVAFLTDKAGGKTESK